MSKIAVTIQDQTFTVEVHPNPCAEDELNVIVNGTPPHVSVPDGEGSSEPMGWVVVENRPYEVMLDHDLRGMRAGGKHHPIQIHELEAATPPPTNGHGPITAMIPGRVTRVFVQPGEQVEGGQPLLVLEAMKMENQICAPRAGRIRALHVQEGQPVRLNALLAEMA